MSEDEWERQFLQSRLLASIPSPPEAGTRRAFQPIKIQGEPLSETIIRELRRLGPRKRKRHDPF